MTAKEAAKLRRLEVENDNLRRMNLRHIEVYRDQAMELIDLRTRLRLVEEALQKPEVDL